MQYVEGTINTLVEGGTRVIRSVFVEVLFKSQTELRRLDPAFPTHVVTLNPKSKIGAGYTSRWLDVLQAKDVEKETDVPG